MGKIMFDIFYVALQSISIIIIFVITLLYIFQWQQTPISKGHMYFNINLMLFCLNELTRSINEIYFNPNDMISYILRILSGVLTSTMGTTMLTTSLYYAGLDNIVKNKVYKIFETGFPILYFCFVVTNPWHKLYIVTLESGKTQIGIGIVILQVIAFSCLLLAVYLYAKKVISMAKDAMEIFLVILAITATSIPFIMGYLNVRYQLVYDFLPSAFCLYSVVLYLYASKLRIFNVLPAALDAVFDGMQNGLYILNKEGEIVFLNKEAKRDLNEFDNEGERVEFIKELIEDTENSDFSQKVNNKKAEWEKNFRVSKKTLSHPKNFIMCTKEDLTQYNSMLLNLEMKKEALVMLKNCLEAERREIEEVNDDILKMNIYEEHKVILDDINADMDFFLENMLVNIRTSIKKTEAENDVSKGMLSKNVEYSFELLQKIRMIVRNLQSKENELLQEDEE